MEISLFKGAIWQLIKHMDWIAIFILIGLFCLSVLCTAIIAFKYAAFRKQKQHFGPLLQRLRFAKDIKDVTAISREFSSYAGGILLAQGLQCIDDGQSMETTEQILNQQIDKILLDEEEYLPVLGSSAAASPLIGLFGTIWGLIHAFVDISQEKSADIATVAPGMAEALIITLAGLIVAIPALVAFHYFSNELRKFELNMVQISDRFLMIIKNNQKI